VVLKACLIFQERTGYTSNLRMRLDPFSFKTYRISYFLNYPTHRGKANNVHLFFVRQAPFYLNSKMYKRRRSNSDPNSSFYIILYINAKSIVESKSLFLSLLYLYMFLLHVYLNKATFCAAPGAPALLL
jgi:hypothetical protein